MYSCKRDMLFARIASLYAYGTYHTRMVIPYAYGIQNCTIRVRYIPYAYGIKYAYGTEHNHHYAKISSLFKLIIPEVSRCCSSILRTGFSRATL